eukprot:14822464-Ditylum_brightwellii.AAC.1
MAKRREVIVKFQVPTAGDYQADFSVYLGFGVLYVNFGLTRYRTFGNWAKGCSTFFIILVGLVAGCGTSRSITGGGESFSTVLIPMQIHVVYGD